MRLAYILLLLIFVPLLLTAQGEACSEAGTLSREAFFGGGSARERRFHIYLPPVMPRAPRHTLF